MSCEHISPSAQIVHHENADLSCNLNIPSLKWLYFDNRCSFDWRPLLLLWFSLGGFFIVSFGWFGFGFVILVILKIPKHSE